MASVEAVNRNSNTLAYTTGAAAAGAIGGGAYGYFSKPYLTKGMPNDAFCRTLAEKTLDSAGEEGKFIRSMFDLKQNIEHAKTPEELAKVGYEFALIDLKNELAEAADSEKGVVFNNLKNDIISDMRELEAKIPNMAELVKKVEEAKTVEDLREVVFSNIKAEIEVKGLETAKKELFEYTKVLPTSLEDAGNGIIERTFDASKKEFNFEGVNANIKKAVTDTKKSFQVKAAMKWAAITAVAAGVVGYIVSKCCEKPEDIQEKGMKAYQG